MVSVVDVTIVVAQVVDWINPSTEARAQPGVGHKGDGELAEFQLPIFYHILVGQPDKSLVAPLYPVKMLAAIGLKGITHAIPRLDFNIPIPGCRPGQRW